MMLNLIWLPDRMIVAGTVQWFTPARKLLLRVLAVVGLGRGS